MVDNLAEQFIHWLDSELARMGWNDYQLSLQAGISHSMISRARRGTPPGWDVCEALARALHVPADLVFRKAGLLPDEQEDEAGFERWRKVLALLPEAEREELLQIALLKLRKQEELEARAAQTGRSRALEEST